MLIGTVVFIPPMVTAFAVLRLLIGTLICGAKLKASGVVIAAIVVTVKLAETVFTLNVATAAVNGIAEDVSRTVTTSPALTVPATLVYAPLLTL